MSPFQIFRATGSESLPKDLDRFAAPQGWPIPIHSSDGSLVEPVYKFIRTKYRSYKRKGEFNTQRAISQDLKDWWDFLAYYSIQWSEVRPQDFYSYRDAMLSTISPHTKLPYSNSTVVRRVGSVIRFYDWCNSRSITEIELPSQLTERQLIQGIDRRSTDSDNIVRSKGIVACRAGSRDDSVEYISLPEIELLRKELGPLPSSGQSTTKETRDRLTFELMLTCGLRLSEVTGLYSSDIEALDISSKGGNDRIPLAISRKAKGGKSRRVLIPVSLVRELLSYIATERQLALAVFQARSASRNLEDPPELFLNSRRSAAYGGQPLKTGRIGTRFKSACIRADLVQFRRLRSSVSDAGQVVKVARFTPHHLRHTFAINEYHAQRRAGNSEPWKIIQVLLGHSSMATTQETYLRICTLTESEISQASFEYLISAIDESHDQ